MRPLGGYPYAVLDARYEKMRHGGAVVDCAVLLAMGVDTDGQRELLGVSVALSEAEVHWCGFLSGLAGAACTAPSCLCRTTTLPEGLTVFTLSEHHSKRMRTSNAVERVNKEIKRRTLVATLFPNEASCLRLVTAVTMEIPKD